MSKVLSPVVFILFAGMFSWFIFNDNSPKENGELVMNIVVSIGFIFMGSWFAFFPKSVDQKNKRDHAAMYERTGIKLFKKLSESVDKNPVNSIGGKIAGACVGFIGLAMLIKSLLILLF